VQGIALLQDAQHGVGFGGGIRRLDLADGLVLVRIELLAQGIDRGQAGLFEGRNQLAQGQLDAFFEVFGALVIAGQGGFKAVLDRQQFGGKTFDGEFAGLGDVFLGAAADVLAFGLARSQAS
jgi:hypothetical protein